MPPSPETVFLARTEPRYGPCAGAAPTDVPAGSRPTTALVALRTLLRTARLDESHIDRPTWNPLGDLVPEGARVLVKPNWVLHENLSGAGVDCLITHSSVLEAVLMYLARARPSSVIVADAPVQGCNFEALRRVAGIDETMDRCSAHFEDLQLLDLRLTRRDGLALADSSQQSSERSESQYTRFDLGSASLLDPISKAEAPFRVTMYDPRELERTHGPGRHCYLVAREALEADVVISLPKLKTHAKAGITGALKNMVGINGHKSFLPHHRKGGTATGGDCYEGRTTWKALAEELLDAANRRAGDGSRRVLGMAAGAARRIAMGLGHDRNIEGEWHGNDTVWRMCLDLQRILHYGTADGRIEPTVQRGVLTITDAIIAGEGDGPLAPTPVALGVLSLGLSPPALEWVHAHLMGLDPQRIPLVAKALTPANAASPGFRSGQIRIKLDGLSVSPIDLCRAFDYRFRPARGWIGYCER